VVLVLAVDALLAPPEPLLVVLLELVVVLFELVVVVLDAEAPPVPDAVPVLALPHAPDAAREQAATRRVVRRVARFMEP
jgi:hypothetical protein